MHGFDDVTLGWKGEEYTVPANQMLMLVCKIEDALAGDTGEQALTVLMRRQGPPHARLAQAYGAALRFAGAKVSDDDVYLSMQSELSQGSAEGVASIQAAVINLIAIISPPLGSVLLAAGEKKSDPVTKTKKKAKAE